MMRNMQSESTLALIAKIPGNSNRECRLCRNTMPRPRRNARVYFLAEDWMSGSRDYRARSKRRPVKTGPHRDPN